MAYRFTNTEKWNDAWFSELKPLSKLLFLYLCDQCDIAGFLEVNTKKIAFDLGIGKQEAERTLQGLDDKLLYSYDRRYIFIKNFIKNQRNYPLSQHQKSHIAIIRRLNDNLENFKLHSVEAYFDRVSIPLGKGTGIGILYNNNYLSINNTNNSNINWKNDFEIYKKELHEKYSELIKNKDFISEQERYHPNLNIALTIEKAYKQYWSLEAGWKQKKRSKTEKIDWKATFTNALNLQSNKVYKTKETQKQDESDRVYRIS